MKPAIIVAIIVAAVLGSGDVRPVPASCIAAYSALENGITTQPILNVWKECPHP